MRVFLILAWTPYVYKVNMAEQDSLITQSWKIDLQVKTLRDSDRESPSCKKWLNKEKTGAGPDI